MAGRRFEAGRPARMKVAAITVIVLGLALPAQAHTEAEQRQWEQDWRERADVKLTTRLVAEWVDFQARHAPPPPAPTTTARASSSVDRSMGSNVEQWRGLVSGYFADVDRALCLMQYESGGNPTATSYAGARGLMQVMPFWARHLGISVDALYDPATNLEVAAYVYGQQGWWAWSPYKRGLCR